MKLLFTITLLLTFLFPNAQTKVKTDTTHKVVNDTLVILSFKEAQVLAEWIDKQNAPHQEVKQLEQFIYDRVKIIPRTQK
jgi:hypothetical protein